MGQNQSGEYEEGEVEDEEAGEEGQGEEEDEEEGSERNEHLSKEERRRQARNERRRRARALKREAKAAVAAAVAQGKSVELVEEDVLAVEGLFDLRNGSPVVLRDARAEGQDDNTKKKKKRENGERRRRSDATNALPRLPGGGEIDIERLKDAVEKEGGYDYCTKNKRWRVICDKYFPVLPGCENLCAGKLKHVYAYMFMPGSSEWMEANATRSLKDAKHSGHVKKSTIVEEHMNGGDDAHIGANGDVELPGRRSKRKRKEKHFDDDFIALEYRPMPRAPPVKVQNAVATTAPVVDQVEDASDDDGSDGKVDEGGRARKYGTGGGGGGGRDVVEVVDVTGKHEEGGKYKANSKPYWRKDRGHFQNAIDAPVVYPTEDEFEDPHKYILSLKQLGMEHGIVRIVPPSSFGSPPFGIDVSPFVLNFGTRWQALHKLQHPELPDCFTDGGGREGDRALAFHTGETADLSAMFDLSSDFEAEYFGREWVKSSVHSPMQWHGCARNRLCNKLNRHTGSCNSSVICPKVDVGADHEGATVDGENRTKMKQVEAEFWRIVEDPTEEVYVLYGADIDTTKSSRGGAGFPLPGKRKSGQQSHGRSAESPRGRTAEAGAEHSGAAASSPAGADPRYVSPSKGSIVSAYRNSPWNPHSVARSPHSLLRHVYNGGEEIPGLTKPFMYVGTALSAFAWHTEDYHLYSLNYHHFGAPKVWYAVPPGEAELFERAARSEMHPTLASQPDILYQLVTILSPEKLAKYGVHVRTAVQRAGEFIVTYPRAYHSGFNAGFNCCEAVNLACKDWLPSGWDALREYRANKRSVSFSMEQTLLSIACNAMRIIYTDPRNARIPELARRSATATSLGVFCEGSDGIVADAWIDLMNTTDEQKENMRQIFGCERLRQYAVTYDVSQGKTVDEWHIIKQACVMLKSISANQKEMWESAHAMAIEKGRSLVPSYIKIEGKHVSIISDFDDADCEVCKRDLFLSAAVCTVCKKVTCGHHVGRACACEGPIKFVYRMTPPDLLKIASVAGAAADVCMKCVNNGR